MHFCALFMMIIYIAPKCMKIYQRIMTELIFSYVFTILNLGLFCVAASTCCLPTDQEKNEVLNLSKTLDTLHYLTHKNHQRQH